MLPIESIEPKRTIPLTRYLHDRAVPERPDGLSDLELLTVGGRLVDRDLAVALGPPARHELERVQALVGGGVDADGDALVRVSDRLAVLVDESRRVLDRALGEAHSGKRLDLAQEIGGERRRLGGGVGGVDRLLGADHGVGALVRLVVDAVEALGERVGEDEAAADHRDAEDDRERRQRGPELPAEQALERDADHRTVTSSSVSRISCVVERPRSLTTAPSARNRTRSAIAAAWASWVTMTVVCP